ncbi:PE-PPE domain-containing protein [Candidatus Mycobacterium wuenschmannii]|uniref:PE-PPE domain-containing protein n=1 Tax=Candidatus Mycobacterium wuenschmannii TaxID=3027808 RepID=A0ABY8W472_9MYCO|nr:PE-PPE domain-containing protein [Candidatus Mycobacterium wuenschmannii]WIM89856.1 PE-PPE domain-containing protein [Candidatus Mycobacterium wuenschmannii]
MKRRGLRWLGAGLLATTGAGLLEASSLVNPALSAADDTALLMGYAATPNPLPSYVTDIMRLFVNPNPPLFDGQPTYPGYTPEVQPVELGANYQLVLTEGVSQLDQGIRDHLMSPDDHVVVFGYSESSSIATQEMINLGQLPVGERPGDDQLSFILFENLNNPNGGFLERFPELAGIPFPATPADTPYDTAIYSIEYSGSSDFPQYPLNLLATANAMAGFLNLHTAFLPGWPTTFDPSSIAGAVELPTSVDDLNTDYFLIPTQNLPILDLLRAVPFIGKPSADLIQPAMRVLIDLGYDRSGPADLVTPADWTSMPDIDWAEVSAQMQLGWQQGMVAAMVDLGLRPQSDLPDMYPYLPDIPGLIGSTTPDAATASAVDFGDASWAAFLGDVSTWATNGLTSLFGADAVADFAALFSPDLLSSPLDFLGI